MPTPEGRVKDAVNYADITNQRFGRLVVSEFLGLTPRKQACWRAVCGCGRTVVVRAYELVRGDTRSCGCLLAEANREKARAQATHQRSRSAEYRAWRSMKDRCLNPKSKDWRNYGGRGIHVYATWAASFEEFLAYVGRRPANTSLDRIDVNGDYAPGNVRWATTKVQGANKRSTRIVDGKPLAWWAEELGVTPAAMYKRFSKYGSIHGKNT